MVSEEMNPKTNTTSDEAMTLSMECENSSLSTEQINHKKEAVEEYNHFLKKINDMMSKRNVEVIEKGKHVSIYEINFTPKQYQNVAVKSENCVSSLSKQNTTQANIVLSNGSIATPVSSVFNGQPGTYKLVVAAQPRMNLLVNTPTAITSSNISPVVTASITRPIIPRVQVRPGLRNINNISPKRYASSAGIAVSSPMVVVTTAIQKGPATSVKTTTAATPLPTSTVNTRSKAKVISTVTIENVQSKPQASVTIPSPSTVVDLTNDDGKLASELKDTAAARAPSRLFPSLIVVARPSLRIKEMTSVQANAERSHLDTRVKGILTNSPTKFTEWLIQQGLVRSEQYCTNHSASTDIAAKKLQLGMYNDVSRFPYSGGYVWISECCPQKFVSVFCNSIFDGAPHSPTVLLKLIYHWACQTNVHNIIMWVKVDHLYIKNFFTNLRSICTAAVCEKFGKLGGPNKKLEVGVISLGTTCNNGNVRQVKVEVLGLLDPVSKCVRLRAVDPIQHADKNNKLRFSKILESLKQWVHPATIIVTDFTVDKCALQALGFPNVIQANPEIDTHKDTNKAVMDYLKRVVPRMFQNTLSLLSRSIIQQFLDELVWRERWGSIPSRAFDMLVAHIAEVTRLDTGDSLVNRLKFITSNPFQDWSYKNWKLNCETISRQLRSDLSNGVIKGSKKASNFNSIITTLKVGSSKGAAGLAVDDSSDEAKSISSNLADVDEDSNSVISSSSRKSRSRADDAKGQVVFSNSLEKYYYGTLPPDGTIISKLRNVELNMKCFACGLTYNNNIKFLKHLVGHAQNEGAFTTDHQCRYCLKNFTSDVDLEDHHGSVHFSSRYNCMCLICGQRFRTRAGLISHMQNIHVELELPYQCNICKFRTSEHTKIIDHFHDVHDGGEKVQCPFCLKVVSFENSSGAKITQNVEFFFCHLQRHQKKPLRKCSKCVLTFVNKTALKDHTNKDHVSCNHITGILRHDSSYITTTMMPAPFSNATVNRKSKSVAVNVPLVSTRALDNVFCFPGTPEAKCLECNKKITASDHFTTYVRCMKCMFASCCLTTVNKHTEKYHDGKNKRKVVDRKSMPLSNPLFCVCGYSSACGNIMASHLALCKRRVAYWSREKASQNTVSTQSASFPPLVNLDDMEDDSADVSGKWLRALLKGGTVDEEEEKLKKKLINDYDPPPFLGELGLMRKDASADNEAKSLPSSSGDKNTVNSIELPLSDDEKLEDDASKLNHSSADDIENIVEKHYDKSISKSEQSTNKSSVKSDTMNESSAMETDLPESNQNDLDSNKLVEAMDCDDNVT